MQEGLHAVAARPAAVQDDIHQLADHLDEQGPARTIREMRKLSLQIFRANQQLRSLETDLYRPLELPPR